MIFRSGNSSERSQKVDRHMVFYSRPLEMIENTYSKVRVAVSRGARTRTLAGWRADAGRPV